MRFTCSLPTGDLAAFFDFLAALFSFIVMVGVFLASLLLLRALVMSSLLMINRSFPSNLAQVVAPGE